MTAALIIFAVFGGASMLIGTVAGSILIASGKLTLPNTNARRLQQANAALRIKEMDLERERVQTMLDAQIELRITKALERGSDGS